MLYGSGASGGVVNVVSGRIPNQLFKSPKGDVEIRGNTATEERTGAFNATGSFGQASWSVGGFKRKTGDYHIPGRADARDLNSEKGVVRNSAMDSGGVSVGGSFVGERGFIGGSISRLESEYGIPSPEGSRIDLKQTRYDLSGELDEPIIGFEKLKVRMGYNDYNHNEIEGTGEVATRFKNKGLESRAELLHAPIANWKGVFGIQFQDRDFSALGEEAVVPITKSNSTGLFLVEERSWDRWRLELGGRIERATQAPQNNINPSRAFNLYNVSAGTLWKFMDGYGLGLSATRGQRAPSTEELYINGAHRGTATFQTGDSTLTSETTDNIDLALRKTTGVVKWKVNIFHNWIGNYIFIGNADRNGDGIADRSDDTGTLDPNGEFLVQNFAQTKARFYGAEAEAIFTLKPEALDLRLFADYVRGKLEAGGNVPRTTPPRFGLELNHKMGRWTAMRLFAHACDAIRGKLEAADPRRAALIGTVVAEAAERIQATARAGSQTHAQALAEAQALHAQGKLDETRLLGFVEEGVFDKTAIALSLMCDVPIGLVERTLIQNEPEQLLVLAKAIDLSWETTKAILHQCAPRSGVTKEWFDQRFAGFLRLQPKTAKTALQFYRLRERANRGPA